MPTLGIDIGRHRFRIVEVESVKGDLVLKNFGAYEGEDLNLDLNSPQQISKYAQVLKDFVKDHGFGTSHAVVSLPEQDVFIRVIKTPYLSQKELNDFIKLGAEEYIPIPLSEVTFDAQIISDVVKQDVEEKKTFGLPFFGKKEVLPSPEDIRDKSKSKEDMMSVLLVASRNDILNRYVDLIKQAGLTPVGIEPETLSVERVLGDTAERPNATIVVNFGSLSTQLIITYKGHVRFTRSVPVGGEELTKAIQKELDLELIQAEEYKKAYGLDEGQVDGKVYNAIKPVFDKIILELNRSKMYYTSHNPNVMINRVIMTGGTALMPGLMAYVVNKLDVEAELSNPWRNIKLSEKIQHSRNELMDNGPLYSTAVGLALKEL